MRLHQFDLTAAMAAVELHTQAATELTFSGLARAFQAARCDDSDTRVRKWLGPFGNRSAWAIPTAELEHAAAAMLRSGYKPSTVNRDSPSSGQSTNGPSRSVWHPLASSPQQEPSDATLRNSGALKSPRPNYPPSSTEPEQFLIDDSPSSLNSYWTPAHASLNSLNVDGLTSTLSNKPYSAPPPRPASPECCTFAPKQPH